MFGEIIFKSLVLLRNTISNGLWQNSSTASPFRPPVFNIKAGSRRAFCERHKSRLAGVASFFAIDEYIVTSTPSGLTLYLDAAPNGDLQGIPHRGRVKGCVGKRVPILNVNIKLERN